MKRAGRRVNGACEQAILRRFVDALREVLDLEPLYSGRRRTVAERFHREHEWPRAKSSRAPF